MNVFEDEEPEEREINNNPYIFSTTVSVLEHSFVDSRQPYNNHCPPPKYMDEATLLEPLAVAKDDILRGLEYNEKNGSLVCND